VFDFHGLIIDSEGPDLASWSEVFAARGCRLPLNAWVAAIGAAAGTLDLFGLIEHQLGRPAGRPGRDPRRATAAVFVGDDPRWDVAGPPRPGMRTILLQRAGATGDAPAEAIATLRDLPPLLGITMG
jgi:beta-phosphoglucomutase-like phosphatase (HAD superfamily)